MGGSFKPSLYRMLSGQYLVMFAIADRGAHWEIIAGKQNFAHAPFAPPCRVGGFVDRM